MAKLKGFSLVHLNVRSVHKKMPEIEYYLGKYDVIGLTETWLNPKFDSNMISMSEYVMIRQDRTNKWDSEVKLAGGGSLFYIAKSLSDYIFELENCSKVTKHLEQLWIKICKPKNKTQIVGLIYRPPNASVSKSLDELRNTLTEIVELTTGSVEFTLFGDFNIDYKKTRSADYKLLKSLTNDFLLKQYIKDFTRVTNKCKSQIDLIFSNMNHVIDSGVLEIPISDHYPVFIVKKKKRESKEWEYTRCRSYKNYDIKLFQEGIANDKRWKKYWNKDNKPSFLWDLYHNILLDNMNIFCPFRNIRIRKNRPPWLTQDLLSQLDLRDCLYRKMKRMCNECSLSPVRRPCVAVFTASL